jgi:predicted dehydrogenase
MKRRPKRKTRRELRIGIVGTGSRGIHLASLAHKPDEGSRVVAGCNVNPDALKTFRKRFGPDTTVTKDYRRLVARPDIDAVFVTSVDFLREEHALAALHAEKSVYLEKPMAITLEGCDRILRAAHDNKVRLFVGHNMRHAPVILKMKELIGKGAIDEVKAGWCQPFVCYGGDAYFMDWHAERSKATSLLLQKGAHDMDVLHWLCGGHSRRVNPMGGLTVSHRVKDRHDPSERGDPSWQLENWPPLSQTGLNPLANVEDLSRMLMELDNGVFCSYQQPSLERFGWGETDHKKRRDGKVTMRSITTQVLIFVGLAHTCAAGDFIQNTKSLPDVVADYGVVRSRTAFAMPAAAPLTVDGKLDEDLYKAKPNFTEFAYLGSPDKPRLADGQTHGWTAFDVNNLYLGFRCFENVLNKLRTTVTNIDNAAVWEDDEVEIFLDPDQSGTRYYQFLINANGVMCDARLVGNYGTASGSAALGYLYNFDKTWNSGAKVASGSELNAWTLEVAIPWKAFGLTRVVPGYSCAFNLTRHRTPAEENASWSRLDGIGGNHNPRRFGLLVCGNGAPYVSIIEPPDFCVGLDAVKLTIQNPTAAEARIAGKRTAGGGALPDGQAAVSVPPGKEGALKLAYTVAAPGKPVTVSVEVQNGNNLFFAAQYEGVVPQPLRLTLPRKDLLSSKKTEKALAEAALSKEAMAAYALQLDLLNADGKTIRSQQLKPIPSRFLEINFDVAGLGVGNYKMRGTILGADGKPLASVDAPMNVITDPYDF